ncbi:hypothetical protein AB8B22_05060 [Leptotrichia sp. HSP-334]|jgi:hypothetical protein|uniref:Uncharacterized protein n=1 Tax=Leptotrichia rugosa TaxID=3239302 RepID=A0AB39VKV7_9FUSO|nr:hypothetical protein [Leptotrichia sp. oral taxon 498]
MKKLMIFLIAGLSLQSFAKVNAGANVIDKPQNELTKINSCEFLNKSDDLLKRVISQIKSGNKANEIFCDSDGTKMVYYLLQNGNYDLNIGIAIKVDNNTTNSEFKETFYKKLDEYKNLLKTINTAKIKKENLPDSEVVRFYGQIDENKFFVIGKLVYDMKTKTYRVVGSTQGKELFDRISLFDRLDSVTYSDEIYF